MAASKRDPERFPTVRAAATSAPSHAPASEQRITRRILLNLLEAFFRRPWLYLLPIVLALAWGVASAASGTKEYRSVGTINATTESILGDLTEAANAPGFTFETPASVTARHVNELLRTREFLRVVTEEMGLSTGGETDPLLLQTVRRSVGAYADGDNLVRIAAATDDPELSQRLAKATMDSYRQWIIDNDVAQSTEAEQFFENLVAQTEEDLRVAQDALNRYALENPVEDEENRPLSQRLQIESLQAVVDRAATQYQNALDKRDEANLATAQARTVVEQRLQVVDEPEVPLAAEPRLRDAIMTVAIFAVLGTMISIALLVVAAMLDRTVRVPADIEARLGVEVLAIVPASGR